MPTEPWRPDPLPNPDGAIGNLRTRVARLEAQVKALTLAVAALHNRKPEEDPCRTT